MPWERDPVSTWFDDASWRFLERAYRARGQWATVYLAPPSAARLAQLAARGINPWERDRWGEQRWSRSFKRSVYHTLNYYGGTAGLRPVANTGAGAHGWHAPVRLEWQTGELIRKAGWPTRRRAIRVRIHPDGAATSNAGRAKTPDSKRWVDDDGEVTERQSLPVDPNGSERSMGNTGYKVEA